MINNAINLSQGFPDFAAPAVVKQAAIDAINADINQYAITWGSKSIRDAIVAKFGEQTGVRNLWGNRSNDRNVTGAREPR